MASRYTSLGTNLWNWEPWTKLESPVSRLLWIALYTSPSAKRLPPGLYSGSINALADESHIDGDSVRKALDDLRGANLIEWDQGRRLVRLTQFPDALERATNGSHLRGWWNAFRTIEVCRLRDSHVTALRWLLEQGVITDKMEEAWQETFGHPTHGVKAHPAKRSGPIPAQSSLFPLLEPPKSDSEEYQGLRTPSPEGVLHPREGHPQDQDQDLGERVDGPYSDHGLHLPDPGATGRAISYSAPRQAIMAVPSDPRGAEIFRLLRVLVPLHVEVFNRVRTALKSDVRPMAVVGDPAERELQALLHGYPSLVGFEDDARHVIAIREAEAIANDTTKYLGPTVWKLGPFGKARTLTIADVIAEANQRKQGHGAAGKGALDVVDEIKAELEAEAAQQQHPKAQ